MTYINEGSNTTINNQSQMNKCHKIMPYQIPYFHFLKKKNPSRTQKGKKKLMAKIDLFDLEKQFAIYGSYHHNPANLFIHMLLLWPIFFTTLVILYFTPPLINLCLPFSLIINYGFLFTMIYAVFYVCLDAKAGSFAGFMGFLSWVFGSFLANVLGFSLSWKVVLAAQLFCWSGLVIGHGVFEKRAPDLLNNLTQAFVMEPFFVFLEALQMAFSYEPNPGFHARVKTKVDANIKEWKENKHKKIS